MADRLIGRHGRATAAVATVVALAVSSAGCGSDERRSVVEFGDYPAGLERILGNRPAPATDRFEVFVCHVPIGTTDPTFGDLPLRLSLRPATIAEQMNAGISTWFAELSNDRYRPEFVAGSPLTMAAGETHGECVERAIESSGDDTAAVMVVADAEHVEGSPGGWGRPGAPCRFGFCPAFETHRALYVGASDFHPDWGPIPLLDLIEHEIGHTLGLPHSGDGNREENQHTSALDVMSNSAAPRELVEGPGTDESSLPKNGQGTIAINRLALGWLGPDDVAVVAPGGGRYRLSDSAGTTGLRMLVLPIDDETFLTVEHLRARGLDEFFPTSGLAVHRIDQDPSACPRAAGDDEPCTGIDRAQITLGSEPPHLDLLDAVGDSWTVDGWSVTVTATGELLGVEVRPTER